MPESTLIVPLTPDTLPVFLSIFGDLDGIDRFRGRRSTARRPSRVRFEYIQTFAAGGAELMPADAEDISEAGIGFVTRAPLTVGETIQIFLRGEALEYTINATVMHCTRRNDRYRVGAKFVWD